VGYTRVGSGGSRLIDVDGWLAGLLLMLVVVLGGINEAAAAWRWG
jgi:hypothetical protein